MEAKQTLIYLVRHGETEGNVNGIYQGQNDTPLTDLGIKQSKELGGKLRLIDFQAVYSSDLLRAKRTAELVLEPKPVDITLDRRLRERDFGIFTGKLHSDVYAENKGMFDVFVTLSREARWTYDFNGIIESDQVLSQRMSAVMHDIVRSHMAQNILVVSHGGAIRTFLGKLDPRYYDLMPGNASCVQLKVVDGVFHILESEGYTPLRLYHSTNT